MAKPPIGTPSLNPQSKSMAMMRSAIHLLPFSFVETVKPERAA